MGNALDAQIQFVNDYLQTTLHYIFMGNFTLLQVVLVYICNMLKYKMYSNVKGMYECE